MKYLSPIGGHGWKGKLLPGVVSLLTALGLIYGIVLLSVYSLEPFSLPVLAVLLASILALLFFVRYSRKELDTGLMVTGAACVFSMAALMLLPVEIPPDHHQYMAFMGIFRSFIAAAMIISICLSSLCSALYRFLGSTQRAFDLSRYPILILPIVVVLIAYGFILFTVITGGLPKIRKV